MACWLYEGVLLFGVFFMTAWLFSTLAQMRNAVDDRKLLLQLLLLVVLGVYFVWFWSRGQTLAMKTWHIRITDAQGQPLKQRRALLRYLLAWVWFLPPLTLAWALNLSPPMAMAAVVAWILIWALSSRWQAERQFWHDVWAGTRLVSAA